MARVVITGGAGFIGSHLSETFLDNGDEVVCIDNFLTGSKDNITHLMDNELFEFMEHNITEYIDGDRMSK